MERDEAATRAEAEPESGVSRREVLVRAAQAAAAGAVISGGAVAAPAAADTGGQVASGPKLSPAFSFAGRILQNGNHLEGYGFVIDAAGLDDAWLFADPAHEFEHSEASARLTVFGAVELESRTVRGNVFVLDAVGELAVHRQSTPGASFDDLPSFTAGPVVARYTMRLQDVLTVIAPDEGIPSLSGELTQIEAATFDVDGTPRRFGHRGLNLSLTGTGHGVRQQAEPPIASIDLLARLTVV